MQSCSRWLPLAWIAQFHAVLHPASCACHPHMHVICISSAHVVCTCMSSTHAHVCNEVNLCHFRMGLGLAFGGRTEERNYIEMGLSTPRTVKLMAKYCISLDFRPSTMEFSTRHLTLCNRIYLSGCSWFKQVGIRSNQLDLVPVCMI